MKEINSEYADCYVLSNERNENFVFDFLNYFIPNRKETADEYCVPMYSDKPEEKFKKDFEIIEYLCLNKNVENTLYWSNNTDSYLKGAMMFFTNDGHLIFGLYCHTRWPNTEIEDEFFSNLKEFCNSKVGYITYEDPSVLNSLEFIKIAKERNRNL